MSIDHSDEVGWPATAQRVKRSRLKLARHLSVRHRQRMAMLATNRVRRAKSEARGPE